METLNDKTNRISARGGFDIKQMQLTVTGEPKGTERVAASTGKPFTSWSFKTQELGDTFVGCISKYPLKSGQTFDALVYKTKSADGQKEYMQCDILPKTAANDAATSQRIDALEDRVKALESTVGSTITAIDEIASLEANMDFDNL